MKINEFEIVDRCLFWKEKKILVVGDLHLGYEECLMERGVSFPKTQIQETLGLFEKIFGKIGKVRKIILLGDVKHYFAGILNEEFGDFFKLVCLFQKHLLDNGKIIITKGNHDVILEPVIRNYDFVKLVNYYVEGNVLFLHGNQKDIQKYNTLDTKIEILVIGHYHPAVVVKEDSKKEKYKCILSGKFKNKQLIILPSFFPLVEGTDILMLSRKCFIGIEDISDFNVYILSGGFGEVLNFGKIKNLQ